MAGSTFEQVVNYVSSPAVMRRSGSDNFNLARAALMSVKPPNRPDMAHQAPNAAGRGVFFGAILSLAESLERQGALVEVGPMYPFSVEGSGYFASYWIDVRSRRARRTRNPLRIEVRFDTMAGHWAHMGPPREGGGWIGNTIPAGGKWFFFTTRIPATCHDYVQPAVDWIKSRFQDALVVSGGGAGDGWSDEHWSEL